MHFGFMDVIYNLTFLNSLNCEMIRTHLNYVCILVFLTLKKTTRVSESCYWPLCNKTTSINPNSNVLYVSFSSSSLISSQNTRYSMSWCALWLTWWRPLQRRDLLWVQSLLIEVLAPRRWGFSLSLNLLTTQTMVTMGILPPQGKSPL
jgi:hypothetical protein